MAAVQQPGLRLDVRRDVGDQLDPHLLQRWPSGRELVAQHPLPPGPGDHPPGWVITARASVTPRDRASRLRWTASARWLIRSTMLHGTATCRSTQRASA